MKKTFLPLLFAIIFILSSCAQAVEDEIIPEYDDGFVSGESAVNLNGKTFYLKGINHEGGDCALLPPKDETALGDALLARYKELEKKFNCIMDVDRGTISELWVNFASGTDYADLMNSQLTDIVPYMKLKLLRDLNEIEGIDIHDEEKYGTSTLLKAMTYGDAIYGMMAMEMGEPIPFICGYMWYMPSRVAEIGQTDPHELLESGIWTWGEFEKMCIAGTDTSSPDKNEWKYGSYFDNSYPEYFTIMTINSNGSRPVVETENGLVSNFTDSRTIAAIEWVKSLIDEGCLLASSNGNQNDAISFTEGKYVFATEYNWLGISKMNGWIGKNATEQFNWITFPIGPSGTQGDISSFISWGTNYYFIPQNADDEYVGYVTSALFEPLYTDGGSTWKEVLYSENFWDQTSFDLFMDMFNYPVFDYYSILSVKSKVNGAIAAAVCGKKSASQAMSEINDSVQNALDTELKEIFE